MIKVNHILIIFICIALLYTLTKSQSIVCKHTILEHTFKNNTYKIYEIVDLLTPAECELVREAAKPSLTRSKTISETAVSDIRTSSNTFLYNDRVCSSMSVLLERIDRLTQTLSGKPIQFQEPLQVVKYETNQYFNEHYDCCVPFESECREDRKRHGLRHSTLLIYINDVLDGGYTDFPLVNHSFKPKLGSAIFFFNLNEDETTFHPLSKHAGLPPKTGEKWVCNKWIRTQPYVEF
jgi:prolyl 4-hydroxylase